MTKTGKMTVILLVAAAFALGSWTSAEAATSLTYSIFFPPPHAQAKAAAAWATWWSGRLYSKCSNGRSRMPR